MTEFMPADGEEFEWDNHHSCARDGPQAEEHYRINDYYIEHSKLVMRGYDGAVTVSGSDM